MKTTNVCGSPPQMFARSTFKANIGPSCTKAVRTEVSPKSHYNSNSGGSQYISTTDNYSRGSLESTSSMPRKQTQSMSQGKQKENLGQQMKGMTTTATNRSMKGSTTLFSHSSHHSSATSSSNTSSSRGLSLIVSNLHNSGGGSYSGEHQQHSSQERSTKIPCQNHGNFIATHYSVESKGVSFLCLQCAGALAKRTPSAKLVEITTNNNNSNKVQSISSTPMKQQQQQQYINSSGSLRRPPSQVGSQGCFQGAIKQINLTATSSLIGSSETLLHSSQQQEMFQQGSNQFASSSVSSSSSSSGFRTNSIEKAVTKLSSSNQIPFNNSSMTQFQSFQSDGMNSSKRSIEGCYVQQQSQPSQTFSEKTLDSLLSESRLLPLSVVQMEVKNNLERLFGSISSARSLSSVELTRMREIREECKLSVSSERSRILSIVSACFAALESAKDTSLRLLEDQADRMNAVFAESEESLKHQIQDAQSIREDISSNLHNIFTNLGVKQLLSICAKYEEKLLNFSTKNSQQLSEIYSVCQIQNSTAIVDLPNIIHRAFKQQTTTNEASQQRHQLKSSSSTPSVATTPLKEIVNLAKLPSSHKQDEGYHKDLVIINQKFTGQRKGDLVATERSSNLISEMSVVYEDEKRDDVLAMFERSPTTLNRGRDEQVYVSFNSNAAFTNQHHLTPNDCADQQHPPPPMSHRSMDNISSSSCRSPNQSRYRELLDKINTNQLNTNIFYSSLIKEGGAGSLELSLAGKDKQDSSVKPTITVTSTSAMSHQKKLF